MDVQNKQRESESLVTLNCHSNSVRGCFAGKSMKGTDHEY